VLLAHVTDVVTDIQNSPVAARDLRSQPACGDELVRHDVDPFKNCRYARSQV
jgi:hypothetical protein